MPISASYPVSIASFTSKVDDIDIVFADNVNALQAEVRAIETVLGTLPQGTATTVKDRIAAAEAILNTLSGRFNSSGLIPESGVANLPADLSAKAPTVHTHLSASVTDLSGASVYHATIADTATNAGHATNADNATSATNAGHATNADNATNAGHATNADHATAADNATSASSVAWGNITGKPFGDLNFGQTFIPTGNVNGDYTIPHGLGYQPSAAVVTHFTGGPQGRAIVVTVTGLDSANIYVRAYAADGAPGNYNGAINFFWFAA